MTIFDNIEQLFAHLEHPNDITYVERLLRKRKLILHQEFEEDLKSEDND
jgi:hypothetical protein